MPVAFGFEYVFMSICNVCMFVWLCMCFYIRVIIYY